MRRIFILLFILSGVFVSHSSSAQIHASTDSLKGNKKLFDASYPVSIAFSYAEINKLFKLKKEDSFTLTSCKKFMMKGSVNNTFINKEGIQSIALKLPSLPEGTRMVIIKGANENKVEYKGFILNQNFPDAYKITSSANGFIIFSKMQRKEIVDE